MTEHLQPEPSTRSGTVYALIATGAVLIGFAIIASVSGLGATSVTSTRSPIAARASDRPVPTTATATATPAAETPTAFLAALANALHAGDSNFLLGRLNPVVIARYGESACRSAVATYTDPTAAFTVISVSAPADFTYSAGTHNTVVPNTVTVQAHVTLKGKTTDLPVHVSRNSSGEFTWYTDCSAPSPSG